MSTTGSATAPNGASTPTIALLENLPDAILLLDEAGAIGYANAAAERVFGRPVAELYGNLFTTFLAEPYADEYAKLIQRFGDGAEIPELGQRREIVAQALDGSGLAMDQTTMDMVEELGVDFAQGYHLGKPRPVSELRDA